MYEKVTKPSNITPSWMSQDNHFQTFKGSFKKEVAIREINDITKYNVDFIECE